MPVVNRTPYRNLILTGTMGVGKTGAGRLVAQKMDGANFIDLEIEIYQREGYTPEQIRATFGAARLRSVENRLVEEMTLRRSTVLAVGGLVLLDPANRARLRETGPILCLTAALGEILRRLHVLHGGRFHDVEMRSLAIGRLKRESELLRLDLPRFDTTNMTVEAVAQHAITFWMAESDL